MNSEENIQNSYNKTENSETKTNCEHDWYAVNVPESQIAFSGRQPYKCLLCGAEKSERAE
jgi:hypothetical protein